jgi:1-deoxyxylulose-5-phosphate synthase
MKYRKLGSSDLKVSEISLGSWLTYGGGVDKERARACVNRAFDLGVNLIDTANAYARGGAESFLGETLSSRSRDSYVLATKAYFPMSDADQGLSRAQIFKQIEASLERLRVEYVDLYQCHRYDPATPLKETMSALTEVVRQGKARYIGFSEWSPEQIAAAFALPDVDRFVSSQPQYSMLWRQVEERVIPLCREKQVSQIVWSPLAQGVLTGKYSPDAPPPAGSRASSDSMGQFIKRWTEPNILSVCPGTI